MSELLKTHLQKNRVRLMPRLRQLSVVMIVISLVASLFIWNKWTVPLAKMYEHGITLGDLYGNSLDQNRDLNVSVQVKDNANISKHNYKHNVEPIQDGGKKFMLDTEIPSFDASRIMSQSRALKIDGIRHDKWIVLKTLKRPSEDVKFLASLTGWKVVVVGDAETPKDWSYPNCVFLSVEKQKQIGLSIVPKLPFKHYARKNVGYLYAIAHGAKVIYETDDGNRPLDKLQSFELETRTSGLMFAGSQVFNLYRHFGQPTLWSRGFPLSKVGSKEQSLYRFSSNWPTPAIQQGVVNGDPEMGAIFRLTRKETLQPLDVRFDPAAPPVILPAGVFSPFNSQNTLFLKDGLWAMMIPTTTSFRICDIWRGYWAQRLLWEIDRHLGFSQLNAYQQRNAHDYTADAGQEKDMYYNIDRLLAFLTQWQCPDTLTIFQCAYKLSADMATERFWGDGDVEITKLWLEDLIRVGYTEPKRQAMTLRPSPLLKSKMANARSKPRYDHSPDGNQHHVDSVLHKRRLLTLTMGSSVTFSPVIQPPPSISTDESPPMSPVIGHAKGIDKMCPRLPALSISMRALNVRAASPFSDILLIVVFNWPFYGNINYTEITHRPLFPNIVYCGSNAALFMKDTAYLGKNLSFVDASGFQDGRLGHLCAVMAMQMRYKVKGYLVVGDDVLLNTWNFARFDKDKIWMIDDRNVFNVLAKVDWYWWKTGMGSTAYHSSINALKKMAASDKSSGLRSENKNSSTLKENVTFPKVLPTSRDFLSQLFTNTGNTVNSVFAISDIYYIPQRLRTGAVVYLNHFLKHNLFLELSVPITLYGLDNVTNFESFHGVNLWNKARHNPWSSFTLDNHFLHPVKLSFSKNLLPFCTTYLPALLTKGHNVQSNLTG